MTPTLAEIAYRAWCGQQPTPQPLYKALTFEEQLGWAVGVQAALDAALAVPGWVCPPATSLAAHLVWVRHEVQAAITTHQYSLNVASRLIGVDRVTLTHWLAGDENITVRTLLRLEAWLAHQGR